MGVDGGRTLVLPSSMTRRNGGDDEDERHGRTQDAAGKSPNKRYLHVTTGWDEAP